MTDAWDEPLPTNDDSQRPSPPPVSRSNGNSSEDTGYARARPHAESNTTGNNLHVGGIAARVTEQDLEDKFGQYGKIIKSEIVYDPHTREPRGFAFVTFETGQEADAAMDALDGVDLLGRTLKVQKAKRGRARTPTPGQYMGGPKRDFGGPPPRHGGSSGSSRRGPPRSDRGYAYPVLTSMRGGDPWGDRPPSISSVAPTHAYRSSRESEAYYDRSINCNSPAPFTDAYDRYGNPIPPPPSYRGRGGGERADYPPRSVRDYSPVRPMRDYSPAPRHGGGGGGSYDDGYHSRGGPLNALPPPRSRYDDLPARR